MLSERLVCDNVHANFVLLRELVKLLGYLSVDAEDTGPESPQFCTRDNPREKIDTGIVTKPTSMWDSLDLAERPHGLITEAKPATQVENLGS